MAAPRRAAIVTETSEREKVRDEANHESCIRAEAMTRVAAVMPAGTQVWATTNPKQASSAFDKVSRREEQLLTSMLRKTQMIHAEPKALDGWRRASGAIGRRRLPDRFRVVRMDELSESDGSSIPSDASQSSQMIVDVLTMMMGGQIIG